MKNSTYEKIARIAEASITTVLFGIVALYLYAIIQATLSDSRGWEAAEERGAIRQAASLASD